MGVDGGFRESILCLSRWENWLKEPVKREKWNMLETEGKELRAVAGKAAELESSRQRADRAQLGEGEAGCGAGRWRTGWVAGRKLRKSVEEGNVIL